jgi:hypothetical protein
MPIGALITARCKAPSYCQAQLSGGHDGFYFLRHCVSDEPSRPDLTPEPSPGLRRNRFDIHEEIRPKVLKANARKLLGI